MSGLARSGAPVQARGPWTPTISPSKDGYRNSTNGSPQSYRIAGNANRMIGSQYMWLVRSGWSVGHLPKLGPLGGIGWRPAKTTSDPVQRRVWLDAPDHLWPAQPIHCRDLRSLPHYAELCDYAGFPVGRAPSPESQGGHHVGNQREGARCFLTYGFRCLAFERFGMQRDFLFACSFFLPVFANPGFEGFASGRIATSEGKSSDVGIRDGELNTLG